MRYLDSKIHLPLIVVNEDLPENIFSDDIKLKEDLRGTERTKEPKNHKVVRLISSHYLVAT